MASCNLCRNGYTALGRKCRGGCTPTPTAKVLDDLQWLADTVPNTQDVEKLHNAIGEIIRLQRACGER